MLGMLNSLSKYTNTTLPKLVQHFEHIDLNAIAVQTGLIKRRTAKFNAEAFLLTLLQAVTSGQGSLQNIVVGLSQILTQPLSKQGLSYRFKNEGLDFLKQVSQELNHSLTHTDEAKNFGRVLLQDATQIRLPPRNSQHYKGMSNQWGAKASAKLDVTSDALTSEVVEIHLHHGTHSDRTSAKELYKIVKPGDLVLRDMGYYITKGLEKLTTQGAFWVTRVPSNTSITLESGDSLELYLKSLSQDVSAIDITGYVSEKDPLKTRIIALRCPEEITNRKRAKAKAHRGKMKSKANKFTLEREGWTIYITNLNQEKYSSIKIHELYSQRWAIEIQFRALKGSTQLRDLFNRVTKNKVHLSMLLQAVMIFAQLTAKIKSRLTHLAKKHPGLSVSIEQVSNWFSIVIKYLKSLNQEIIYDLRHLSHGKKRLIAPQCQLAINLF